MADATTTLAVLKEVMRRFNDARRWEPYHTPKNISMSLAVEAAELMELFLWDDSEESRRVVNDPVRMAAVADEIADIACNLINLGNTLNLDLSDAILAKIGKNAVKYPATARNV